jgi:hypothetical protein
MKLETWMTVLGLLLLALLADVREPRPPAALVVDGTLPPGRTISVWLPTASVPQHSSVVLTSMPLSLSMDLVKGL